MKKGVFIIAAVVSLLLLGCGTESKRNMEGMELLHITAMCSDSNGEKEMLCIVYDANEMKTLRSLRLPNHAIYPICIYDADSDGVFLTNSTKTENFDNLHYYIFESDAVEVIARGKYYFSDMIPLGENELLCNVASESATVSQPAIFNSKTKDIKYLDEHDDDTWFHSLSYNPDTQKILAVTCSDEEIRSEKVRNETRIRPKKLEFITPDFSKREVIFETEDYEIRSARQINSNEILMAVDPCMGWDYSARKLVCLNLSTKEVTDVEICGIKQIQSFYPSRDGTTLFVLGKDEKGITSVWSYDVVNKTLTDVLSDKDSYEGFEEVVDFVYTWR